MNDSITDSGEAFIGQGLSAVPNMHGYVQLWNPYGSGKVLYVDTLVCGGEQKLVADLRKCREPLTTLFADHITNKAIDGPDSVAEIRISSGADLTDYPYNRPFHEIWGVAGNDKTYTFDSPMRIPQGRGIAFAAADSRAIASWQWREHTDPLGPVYAGPGGTISSDLANAAYAFDASDTTYANDAETSAFYIGKVWPTDLGLTGFVLKSPTGRSFSGGNPGRLLTWTLWTFDGATWSSTAESGTFTESGPTAQQVIDVTFAAPVTAIGHRIRVVDTAAAAHRVAKVELLQ